MARPRPRLLIVHHTPSPAVRELLDAILSGSALPELADVEVRSEPALSATASDLLAVDAVVLLTPANIGYLSGAMKHFFDSVYYPCMGAKPHLPWGLVVHGNNDTAGAVRAAEKIAGAMGWRLAAPVLSVIGAPGRQDVQAAAEVSSVVAASILEEKGA